MSRHTQTHGCLAALDGEFTYDGHTITYTHNGYGFNIAGDGSIQPSLPAKAAKYGPKRPPPAAKIPVVLSGRIDPDCKTMSWDTFATTDGRNVYGASPDPRAIGPVSLIPELTTAVVKEWRRNFRQAWLETAASRKLAVLLRIDAMLSQQEQLDGQIAFWLSHVTAYQLAAEQLAKHLATTIADMEEPAKMIPPWELINRHRCDYLAEHAAEISRRQSPVQSQILALLSGKPTRT